MTTATDWDDATWTDTGSHAVVTDVRAAVAEASRDDRTERELELEEQLDQLAHENTQLRKQLGGWTPTRDWRTITGAADLTERQRNAAMVAPTVEQLRQPSDDDGPPPNPIAAKIVEQSSWPVWLDEFHRLRKVGKERWVNLHHMGAEFAAWVESLYEPRHRGHVSESQVATHRPRHTRTAALPEPQSTPAEWAWAEYHEPAALPVSAEGQAFLGQGPAPDESMAGRAGVQQLDADAERRRKALAKAANRDRRDFDAVTTSKWRRPTWLTRVFDAVFPLKPREPRKDGSA